MKLPVHVTGAWLMHHDQKLSAVRSNEFGCITTAGRAARLLSFISSENQWSVPRDRITTLAETNGLKKFEISGLLEVLSEIGAVEVEKESVAVLGIDQSNLFSYANSVFESQNPSGFEKAALALSEIASEAPVEEKDVTEELSDEFKLSRLETEDLSKLSKQIGFVDHQDLKDKTLLFNGSLFKRNSAEKTQIILDGLAREEKSNLLEVNDRLNKFGCLPHDLLVSILGDKLWSKLHQIGYFQVSLVTNEKGNTSFVTKPSALIKYVPGGLADMHDDAKALASSLTYGILKSNQERGKINQPDILINALIRRGYVEGFAKAIKEDYQILERRGVVTVTTSERGHRLTLNKPNVGQMAKDLILRGDASVAMAHANLGNKSGTFVGPEGSRMVERLKDIGETKRATSAALDSLRKQRNGNV